MYVERECIKFMATEQPLAKDLMFIESTLRVISHFKRISHLCLKIAKLILLCEGWMGIVASIIAVIWSLSTMV